MVLMALLLSVIDVDNSNEQIPSLWMIFLPILGLRRYLICDVSAAYLPTINDRSTEDYMTGIYKAGNVHVV